MKEKPNILLILSDQHRYDCIGYSKKMPVKTPNLDTLAARGMAFDNAHTPIPICCPARQSLLTGKRPESFGALWNYDNGLQIPSIGPEMYTYTKALQEEGYTNALVGKWHVSPLYSPYDFGFQDYIPTSKIREEIHRKYPNLSYQRGFLGEESQVDLQDSETHKMANHAIDLIEKYSKDNKPWHISLNFEDPHLPSRPSKPFSSLYQDEDIPMWESFMESFENKPYIQKQMLYNWETQDCSWQDFLPTVKYYYSIISQMDEAIGRVLKAIDDNTIVIYTSDHGDMAGSHRMIDKHYILYDDVVRVPLIISWPKRINEGTRNMDFVSNCLDLGPTILDFAKIKSKEAFHGKSLLPILFQTSKTPLRDYALSTYNGQQFGLYTMRMIRNNKWKYIWNTTDIDELYNMEEDPNELNNLIKEEEYKEIVSKLRKDLYYTLLEEGDGLVTSPWMKRQLLNNLKI